MLSHDLLMTSWMLLMTSWKQTPKTKAELREMLAEAVRNTQPQPKIKPIPKQRRTAASPSRAAAGWLDRPDRSIGLVR
jgi:hypothetical protein